MRGVVTRNNSYWVPPWTSSSTKGMRQYLQMISHPRHTKQPLNLLHWGQPINRYGSWLPSNGTDKSCC